MKQLSRMALLLMVCLSTRAAFAGACDTNSASLDRNLNSKCSSKTTRAACETCADGEFNKVVVKIETCRPQLTETNERFKGTVCGQK